MTIKEILYDYSNAEHQIKRLEVELKKMLDSSLDFYDYIQATQYSNEPKPTDIISDLSNVIIKINKEYTKFIDDTKQNLLYFRTIQSIVIDLLCTLTAEEECIIRKRYIEGKAWKEIDINVNQICVKHFKILDKLRNELENNKKIKPKLEAIGL